MGSSAWAALMPRGLHCLVITKFKPQVTLGAVVVLLSAKEDSQMEASRSPSRFSAREQIRPIAKGIRAAPRSPFLVLDDLFTLQQLPLASIPS